MKVGDYVRTKEGKIINIQVLRKVKDLEFVPFPITNEFIEINYKYMNKKDIIKSSPNIIDLIEVGDYVNGYKVTSKDQFLGFGNHDWYMTNDEINSIVTREQFESMEYKL